MISVLLFRRLLERYLSIGLMWVVSLILLMGCSPIKVAPLSTYVLEEGHTKKHIVQTQTNWTLLVSQPVSNPGYRSSAMRYVVKPYTLQSFADNRWVAPPGSMLGLIIAHTLARRGYFHAVAYPPFVGFSDYRLETRLVKLQQEFLLPVSQVRLVVQVVLLNNHQHRVLATRRFSVLVPAPANNPVGGVRASNQATALISQRIGDFCVDVIAHKHTLSHR